VAWNVRAVGIDYLSVGGFRKDGVETHRALLESGSSRASTSDIGRAG
jgi:kynurenine formamidase